MSEVFSTRITSAIRHRTSQLEASDIPPPTSDIVSGGSSPGGRGITASLPGAAPADTGHCPQGPWACPAQPGVGTGAAGGSPDGSGASPVGPEASADHPVASTTRPGQGAGARFWEGRPGVPIRMDKPFA